MSAPAPTDRKSLVLRCWSSASGYWRSPAAPLAWLLLALSIAAVVLQLIVQYRLNFWSRDLFNAIEQKNADALTAQALRLCPACGGEPGAGADGGLEPDDDRP